MGVLTNVICLGVQPWIVSPLVYSSVYASSNQPIVFSHMIACSILSAHIQQWVEQSLWNKLTSLKFHLWLFLIECLKSSPIDHLNLNEDKTFSDTRSFQRRRRTDVWHSKFSPFTNASFVHHQMSNSNPFLGWFMKSEQEKTTFIYFACLATKMYVEIAWAVYFSYLLQSVIKCLILFIWNICIFSLPDLIQ